MARTNRKHLTERNHREARHGAANAVEAWDESAARSGWGRSFHGGMVMSPSASGVWDDSRPKDAVSRKAQRRSIKRAERQRAMHEVAGEMLDFSWRLR